MQIRADFTKEEILNSPDPLALMCFPLGEIKMLADFFWGVDKGELQTGNVFNADNIYAMQGILEDSCKEIDLLVDLSNQQWRIESKGYRRGLESLEKLIEAEDQEMEAMKKTDPEKAVEKFCYILGLTKALSFIKAL